MIDYVFFVVLCGYAVGGGGPLWRAWNFEVYAVDVTNGRRLVAVMEQLVVQAQVPIGSDRVVNAHGCRVLDPAVEREVSFGAEDREAVALLAERAAPRLGDRVGLVVGESGEAGIFESADRHD